MHPPPPTHQEIPGEARRGFLGVILLEIQRESGARSAPGILGVISLEIQRKRKGNPAREARRRNSGGYLLEIQRKYKGDPARGGRQALGLRGSWHRARCRSNNFFIFFISFFISRRDIGTDFLRRPSPPPAHTPLLFRILADKTSET